MGKGLWLVWLPLVLGCPLQTSSSSTLPNGASSSSASGGAASGGNVTVPDVVGKTQSEAEAAVTAAGMRGGIKIGNDPGTYDATSTICQQTPGGGQQTAPSLFVSVRFCHVDKPYVDNEGDLVGLTVEEATRQAKAKGFTGKVDVAEQYEFDKDCKAGTVCRFEPRRWYLNQDHRLILFINRKMSISAPE